MRIVLADDHALVRETIGIYLKRLDDEVDVAEASSLDEALRHVQQSPPPELVILDLVMPGMRGFDGLRKMRDVLPQVPVVILTGLDDGVQAQRALELGAAAFVPKTIGGSALILALKAVLAGERFVPTGLLRDADPAARQVMDSLTAREREVLLLLTDGCSNKEIARRLDVQEVTIKVHLKGVFRKLDVTNRTQAVRKALELGLQGPPTAP